MFLKTGTAEIYEEYIYLTFKNRTEKINVKENSDCKIKTIDLYGVKLFKFTLEYFCKGKIKRIVLYSENLKKFRKVDCGIYLLYKNINKKSE